MAEDDGTVLGAPAAPGPVPAPMAPADAPVAFATSGKAEAFSVAASAAGHLLVGLLLVAMGSLASAQKPPDVIPVKLIPADKTPQKPPQKQAAAPKHALAPNPAHKQPPAPPPKTAAKTPPKALAKQAPAHHATAGAKAPPPPAKPKPAAPKQGTSFKDLAASLGMADYGRKTTLPKKLLAALSAQVKRCWTVPDGWSSPQQVSVTLRFQLHPDGALNGDPAVVEFPATPIGAAAAKAALTAVRKCGPYHLPAAQYNEWKDIQLSLAP